MQKRLVGAGAVIGIAVVVIHLSTVLLLTTCSCKPIPKSDNIEPTADVQTLVKRAVRNWILPRLALTHETTNNTTIFLDRAYRLTQSLQQLIDWLRLVMVPDPDRQDLWDMRELIAQIKGVEIFQTGAVDDQQLHALIIKALDEVAVEPSDDEDFHQD